MLNMRQDRTDAGQAYGVVSLKLKGIDHHGRMDISK